MALCCLASTEQTTRTFFLWKTRGIFASMFLHLFGRFFVLPPIPQPSAGNFFQTETLAITSYEPCHPLNIVHCADVSPPFFTRKKQLSRIFAIIQPRKYCFSRISNPQKYVRHLFLFPRCRENLCLKIFYSAQIKMFNYAIFTVLKRVHPQEFESLWIFSISYTNKNIFLK